MIWGTKKFFKEISFKWLNIMVAIDFFYTRIYTRFIYFELFDIVLYQKDEF